MVYKSKFVRVANWDNLTETSSLLLGLLNSHAPRLPPSHTKPPLFLNSVVGILSMVKGRKSGWRKASFQWESQAQSKYEINICFWLWEDSLVSSGHQGLKAVCVTSLCFRKRGPHCALTGCRGSPSGGHLESALGDWLLYAPTPPFLRRAFYSKGILKLRNIDYLHCVWEILKVTELRGRWIFKHDVYICYDRHSFF